MLRYVGGRQDWFAFGGGVAGTRGRQPRAGDLARRDVPTCRLDDRLDAVRARVLASGWDVCVVVDEGGVVLGRLGRAAWRAAPRTPVAAVMETPTTYRPGSPLDRVLKALRGRRAEGLVITDSAGVLVGQVRPEDVARGASRRRPARGRRRG